MPLYNIFTETTPFDCEYRYGLYSRRLTAPDGTQYDRSLVVLRNGYGDIVRFTWLHHFSGVFSNRVYVPMASNVKERLYHICSMLNFVLIEQCGRFGIDHVFLVTKDALAAFFQNYAATPGANGKYRNPATVEKCVNNIIDFFRRLKSRFGDSVLLNVDELYSEKTVYARNGRTITKRVPLFQVKGIPQHSEIFRELPTKAFKILLNLAFRYAPDIVFAMCLQAFAGLRAGEVCNVRQENSPLGKGIAFTRIGGKASKIEIDLTREIPLRSDGASVGRIKKKRRQCVYPPFIQAFAAAYGHHQSWLAAHGYETEYAPMFVTAKGKAMTYWVYRDRFYSLVDKHFRAELAASSDPELRIYGQLLYEHRLGLHALRHWFSVQLVLHGEDIAQIQYWRGDKSPESAFVYLQNKGDLINELESHSEFLSEILMREGAALINEWS
jgi:integrase